MPLFSDLKKRVGAATQGDGQQSQEDDQSLATLLTRSQRAELSLLIAQTTEEMRKQLTKTFDEKPKPKPKAKEGEQKRYDEDAQEIDLSKLTLSEPGIASDGVQEAEEVRPDSADDASSQKPDDNLADKTPETKALRQSSLDFFDAWAESVILRVGEVANSREDVSKPKTEEQARKLANEGSKQLFKANEREHEVDRQLAGVYSPVETPLVSLSQSERSTIVNAILLLLLSLETYRAHSRVLLVRLAISLHVSLAEVTKMETNIAFGLLEAAAKMDASASTKKAQDASSTARKWKIGAAGVAGAALIGITGGLAAPLLAAGVGTLMGGLGLGATAAAGYLGALAGNAVLVGGLFGAYGARMTSRTMDKYAKEIEDFAFVPINGSDKDDEKTQEKRRRLRLTVGITGWLTEEEQVTQPWRVFGDGGEPFALRWELQALQNLGNALTNFVMSEAWSTIRKELIKRTILAALWSALMAPLAIRKVIKVVDSPFGIAKLRAMKAGEVLADALIEKVQGERPISLIGQSLGARVVYSCLLALARRQAFGLVDNVVLMGAPVPSDEEAWRAMRSVVSGRLINVYSSQDYILAFLYRTSSAQYGVAGIQDIEGVYGVESYDMSEEVAGHLKYMRMTGPILRKVGWLDIDEEVLKKQEMLVKQIDEEERRDKEKGEDPEKASVEVKEVKNE